MNYLIIVTLLLFTGADKIRCPLHIDTSVSCTKENQPVCAFSSEGTQLGTFENPCFACRVDKVSYYENDACIMTTASLESMNQVQENISTSSNQNIIYKCGDTLKSDNPICPLAVFKPTCGLFNSSIQCFNAPCGKSFGNECEACSDKNVDSYFYGECDDILKEDPQIPPIDDNIIYCTEPRPEICTKDYRETCALISTPCFSESCMRSAGNYCDACSKKDVVGYVKQTCAKYQQTYIQDKEIKSDNQNENQVIQQKCSAQKPSSCDNIVKEVCVTYKCNDTNCLKEYQNECQACLDSTTISYSYGKCQSQTLFETILGLVLFLQLLM
ncbi:unnamed protein product [Paramecium pentaurelia]|uniref:Kazal-like domain-containing protein n=1 Tax=Paramecium pentaurelia TaxID=43138 RepID=A0A8S1W127_9CILI|nr:unnamed protein product [Paramecium pentaurelia]